jgi:hypothetical protein
MSPPQRYSFVNARPQTKAEKRQTRTAIRSHIGRWTQEKQQKLDGPASSASEKSSTPEFSPTISPSSAASQQPGLQSRDNSGIAWPEEPSNTGGDSGDPDQESTEDDSDNQASAVSGPVRLRREYPLGFLAESPPIIQVLGSGSLDPFHTYPSNFPSALVSQCHEYCKQMMHLPFHHWV